MSMQQQPAIALPVGWSIPTWRETSQTTGTGQVEQGIAFTLASPLNQKFTVFIPYNILSSTDAVEATFNERIAAIQAITG